MKVKILMDLYVEFLAFLSLALEEKSEGRLEMAISSPLAEFYTVQDLKMRADVQPHLIVT